MSRAEIEHSTPIERSARNSACGDTPCDALSVSGVHFGGTCPMSETIIQLAGPDAMGLRVNSGLLRDLMAPLVDAVQQSVRLRTEGRSRAPGSLPVWLTKAAAFDVEFRRGSRSGISQLVLVANPLGDAAPDRFSQLEMFDPINPECTCIDVFVEAFDDALNNKPDSDRYDDGLIDTLTTFGKVLDHRVEDFELLNGHPRRIERESVDALKELRRSIPADQRIRVAGKLDLLKHSNRIFEVELSAGTVRGVIVRDLDFDKIRGLLGQQVVVSGVAKFRPSGRVLRVEADQLLPASGDTSIWAEMPRPLFAELDVRPLRQPQGPRSGVSAIFGQWPGDESDEEFDAAVRSLS
jgi:hypothetical protein